MLFDLDNRSAQETGYLFESIVSSCLGGKSVSHTESPVKRIVNGKQTNDGRQIDCYIENSYEVYELKLRVTVAASGQGRISEELSFPYEAHMAGLKPILIVFDPTPSSLLSQLIKKYKNEGGEAYIGDAAWSHLESKAGYEMGLFIHKYIYPPIKNLEKFFCGPPCDIILSFKNNSINILSSKDFYSIERKNT